MQIKTSISIVSELGVVVLCTKIRLGSGCVDYVILYNSLVKPCSYTLFHENWIEEYILWCLETYRILLTDQSTFSISTGTSLMCNYRIIDIIAPQDSILSPLISNIAVKRILLHIERYGSKIVGYAEDGEFNDNFPFTLMDVMHIAVNNMAWCPQEDRQ